MRTLAAGMNTDLAVRLAASRPLIADERQIGRPLMHEMSALAAEALTCSGATLDSRDRRRQPERPGICSASAARHSGDSKGSAKYWVS